ncbi:MAG: hypothetical protein WC680_02385 [Sulfuricurvum sp.]|jgi:hypothetical protein
MKRFLYIVYILLILMVMMPKEKLFFTFESFLSKYHLFINGESFTNRLLYLDADNGILLLDNQEIATIGKIRIAPWVLSNHISISSIIPSPLYRTFFPGKIDTLVLTYSLLHPLSLELRAKGDFGHGEGMFDLVNHKVRIVFEATPELRNYPLLVFKLHQEKEGLVYESDF